MKKLTPLLLLLLSVCALYGQNSYTIAPIPYNPDPFASGTNTNINQDDIWGPNVALPFNFCFYDSSYSSVTIGSNGVVALGTWAPAMSYCPWAISAPLPNNSFTGPVICTPWQDLNPSFGGTIRYDIKGVAPYRRFIVSYDQIAMFSCTSLFFTQQVILYETTNVIEFHIQDKPLCSTWNAGAAAQGLQISPTLAYVVPGRDHPTQWTATNDGYRFTPVGACAGPTPADSIYGKVFSDLNGNCVQDLGEPAIVNRGILANSGQFYGWTDINGNYAMSLAAGSYIVDEYMTGYHLASHCQPGGTSYSLTLSGTPIHNVDFADSVISTCTDLSVGVGNGYLRRCDSTYMAITYCNNGNITEPNATVVLTLVDSMIPFGSSIPYTTIGPNTYSFAVGSLLPGQCGTINLDIAVGCDTAGTIHCFSATISGLASPDCNTFNNADNTCEMVRAAYDPNSMHVAARQFSTRGWVVTDENSPNDTLTYRIDFQNLGTSYAEDVVLRDTLDAATLDISSLEVFAGSAPFQYIVIGNELIVTFKDIHLPTASMDFMGSMGFLKFRIRQQPGNLPCTMIQNRAGIYFDQAPLVLTNATTNTILMPEVDLGPDQSVCNGLSVTFSTGNSYPQYLWSTGSTASSLTVGTSGNYILTASYPNGCTSSDTVTLTLIGNQVNLGPDQGLCPGESVTLSTASPFVSYLWSTGSTNSSLTTSTPGVYTLTAIDQNGCSDMDTITLQGVQAIPVFLGNDTTVVLSLALTAPAASGYLWSNGAIGQGITVTQTGDYWVQITSADGCISSDTIHIVVLPTAVTAPTLADLQVSPQPASDRIHVRLPLPAPQCLRLSIHDLAGGELWRKSQECGAALNMDIPVSNLATGTYILNIQGEGIDLSTRVSVVR